MYVYATNSFGTANGGQNTSTTNSFQIVIPGNAFQNVVGASQKANFTGLFYNTSEAIPTSSGYVALTMTNDGSFALNLVSVGATNYGSGQFSTPGCTAVVGVTNPAGTTTYSLALTLDPIGGTVSGYVTNSLNPWLDISGGAVLGGAVGVKTYLATNPIVPAGQYTVALPGFDDLKEGPVGYERLTVGLSNNGTATLAGYLADNTPVSQVAQLSALGICPIYIPLYANGTGGLLMGWLTFTNDLAEYESLTTNSSLIWFNADGPLLICIPLGSRIHHRWPLLQPIPRMPLTRIIR